MLRRACQGAVILAMAGVVLLSTKMAADDAKPTSDKISRTEAKKLKNPIPYTKKSIERGRILFSADCTDCHGADGKAEAAIIANATNLTDPKLYHSGTTDGEIFRSIRDGEGDQMPAFKYQISGDEDLWHLVNFIHSLWPESMRPPLQEDKK